MAKKWTRRRTVLTLTTGLAVVFCLLALTIHTTKRGRDPQGRPVRPALADTQASDRHASDDQNRGAAPERLTAADWPQFRGPMGNGISSADKAPLEWNDTKNIKWKTALPGPGSSSPIVSGDYVFVTCYSGYGVDPEKSGQVESLKRQLLCIKMDTGGVVWSRSVDAMLPEDDFSGMGMTEHGYASNTPVTDGQRVYVFFGKSGCPGVRLPGQRTVARGRGPRFVQSPLGIFRQPDPLPRQGHRQRVGGEPIHTRPGQDDRQRAMEGGKGQRWNLPTRRPCSSTLATDGKNSPLAFPTKSGD